MRWRGPSLVLAAPNMRWRGPILVLAAPNMRWRGPILVIAAPNTVLEEFYTNELMGNLIRFDGNVDPILLLYTRFKAVFSRCEDVAKDRNTRDQLA